MNVTSLLERIEERNIRLVVEGEHLRYRAPKGALTSDIRKDLKDHKAELIAFLQDSEVLTNEYESEVLRRAAITAHIMKLSLSDFERQDSAIEICVPWLSKTLWFVPTKAAAKVLSRDGISRSRIFSVAELRDLMSTPGFTENEARTVTQVKVEFNGTVNGVRKVRETT